MKATPKRELITYEEILQRTNGGYDGFMYYHGSAPRLCKCPWRKDNKASFGFYPYEGLWFWKDIAKEESGTLIEFVMRLYGLSFIDAMNKIKWDFGWDTVKINANPVKIDWEKPEIIEEPALFNFDTMKFQKRHHEYWNCVGISEDYCNKYECYAIKNLAINRQKVPISSNERVFMYWVPEKKKAKIYFPDRKKDNRFKNNVDYFHIWNINNIKPCEKLIVIKSMKDLITVSQLTPCIVSTQNESVQLFSEEIVNNLNSLSDNIYVFYGSDLDGVNKCKKITKEFGWKYINTPKVDNPEINDAYSFAKTFGVSKLEEYLKTKKLI